MVKKTVMNCKNTSVTFHIIRGILEVTLNKQRFNSTSVCTFQIPDFNEYSFKNKDINQVQKFFVQAMIPDNVDQLS